MSAGNFSVHQWRARIKKRRGKAFQSVTMKEINLVAMMDMMTIILVFLLKSYSGSALSLDAPNLQYTTSSNTVAPEEALKLMLTKVGDEKTPGEIILGENEPVLKLDSRKLESLKAQAQNQRNYIIPELKMALDTKANNAREIAKAQNKNFEGYILIVADKDSPYWLVTQVLMTSANSGFDKYNLVSIKKDQ